MGRMLEALRKVGTTPEADGVLHPLPPNEQETSAPQSEPARQVAREPDRFEEELQQDPELDCPSPKDAVLASADKQTVPHPDRLPSQHERDFRKLAERILSQISLGRGTAIAFLGVDEDGAGAAVLANLALALTRQVPGNVLVVDADFRGPALSRRFGIDAGPTILEVLSGAADWEQVIQQTGIPRLSLLPGSHLPPSRHSPGTFKFGHLLGLLRQHYQLVLIGAAGVASPEAQLLTPYADGVYLVIELGRTLRRVARDAVRHLERRGIGVLGCVLIEADE